MNAVERKKQLESTVNWLDFGIGGFEDLTAMLGKFWWLDWMPGIKDMPDYLGTWKMAMEDYSKSFHDYLELMGLVSRDEHLALIGRYEELKKTFKIQEKEILTKDDRIADQKKLMSSMKATITRQKKEIENQKKMLADQKKEITNGLAAIKQLQSIRVGK